MKKLWILLVLFLFTGCWNYNELNNLALATAMAIDKDDENIRVSVLISNARKVSSSSTEGESSTTVSSGTGKTISEAIENLNLKSPKKIYIGHLSVIIIDENLAKKGLSNITDYLFRDPESIKRFYVLIAKDIKAEKIIKVLSPLESFPSQGIYDIIKSSSETNSITTEMPYSLFLEDMLKTGKEAVLPTITLIGNDKKGSKEDSLQQSSPEAYSKLDTIALFKKDKLITYATKEESEGINILNNRIDNMTVIFKNKNGYIASRLDGIKTCINLDLKKDVTFNISVKANASLEEVTSNIDLTKNENMKELEKQLEKKVKNKIKKGIEASIKYKSDVIGFGNLIYKKNPTYFKEYWNKKLDNINTNIKVDISLKSKGSIEKVIGGLLNE